MRMYLKIFLFLLPMWNCTTNKSQFSEVDSLGQVEEKGAKQDVKGIFLEICKKDKRIKEELVHRLRHIQHDLETHSGNTCQKILPHLDQISELTLELEVKKGFLDLFPRLRSLRLEGDSIINLEFLRGAAQVNSLTLRTTKVFNLKTLPTMDSLTELDISGSSIHSIDGIEKIPHLERLDASMTAIESIKRLEDLKYLKSLSLSKMSKLSDLHSLNNLGKLESLDFCDTKVDLLVTLPKLSMLKTLCINGLNPDLFPLSHLKKLENLLLSSAQLVNLNGIDQLPQLRSLAIKYSTLKSLKNTPKHTRLKEISIIGCQLESLEGISSLANLEKVDLMQNNLRSIQELFYLEKLKFVSFVGNPLTENGCQKPINTKANTGNAAAKACIEWKNNR